jgi:site-specific DNA recombinase
VSQSWCQSSIHHIPHNERYRGIVIWGKTYKLRSVETGKRIYRRKAKSEWRRTEIPAQRIISDKLWDAAQARMRLVHNLCGTGSKNGIRGGRAAGSPYLFTGLLKCSNCGGSVTIVSGVARNREDSRYGCSMHAYRGDSVCGNSLLVFRRSLEEQLLAGLHANILRPAVVDYTLRRFEEVLEKARGTRDSDLAALERRKAAIEQQISNCTSAVADGQPSRSLLAKLAELERELDAVMDQISNARPSAVRSNLRDTRKFVEARLRDLRKLLNAEPKIARAAISKHVRKITLAPEGRAYIASGEFDLLGMDAVAVSMVPGDRFARRVYAFSLPLAA